MYNIKVFDNGGRTFDRYIVIINNDVYFMSPEPERANHVFSYGCDLLVLADRIGYIKEVEKENIKLNKIPKTLKYTIRNIIRSDRADRKA